MSAAHSRAGRGPGRGQRDGRAAWGGPRRGGGRGRGRPPVPPQRVSCPPADTQRALRLLQEYRSKLSQAEDRQLRNSIERVIGIFQSNLFQALIGKPGSRVLPPAVSVRGGGLLCCRSPRAAALTHVLFRSAGFCHTLYEFSARPGSDRRCGASLLGCAVLCSRVFHVCCYGFEQFMGNVF